MKEIYLMKEHHFRYSPVALAILFTLTHQYSIAAEKAENSDIAVLDEVVVTESRYAHERQNEVTGLGKVVKNYEEMSKNQILGIRDLTRYDPGISVVEQGRGASSGYAIRGVDKNRVAMLVDGLPQAQSYKTLASQANGGAINEIEYENIRSIELSKGASSAEYGSGALGGAVGFRTKDAQDIIKEGQNWGLDSKTAYASKNSQFVQSIAAAGQAGGFEALLIATERRGKETKIHPAAHQHSHSIERLTGYENRYDLRSNSTLDKPGGRFFLIKDDCPALNCEPQANVNPNRIPFSPRTSPAYSEKEQKQYDQMPYRKETLSANEYTGKERIAPNPLDYRSRSIFLKMGYRFNESHYLGGVLENTKQRYDVRDMQTPSYFTAADIDKNDALSLKNSGANERGNLLDAFVFSRGAGRLYGARYSRAKFFDERHEKKRVGLNYEFKPQHAVLAKWIDKAELKWDNQHIHLNSRVHSLHCSEYPVVDKNCRPSLDKPWSMYETERNNYTEKHNIIRLELSKAVETEKLLQSKHKFHLGLGVDHFNSTMNHGDWYIIHTQAGYERVGSGRGTLTQPDIFQRKPRSLQTYHVCNSNSVSVTNCDPRHITGHNRFITLRDLMTSQYLDLGLGIRFDQHRFKSKDDWTISSSYRNWSWNAGITVKPTENIGISYRISNGFRVPAFYELFGKREQSGSRNELTNKDHQNRTLAPEKSTNHEFGVSFKGNFGYFDVSYFRNHYRNLIAESCKINASGVGCVSNFHNTQNVALNGVALAAKFDLHGILSLVPDGFYSSLAYNRVKVKKREILPGFTYTNDPTLDAVQPGRYVIGFGYEDPEGKWGIGTVTIYSKAKLSSELEGSRHLGNHTVKLAGKVTRSWYTHDLTGFVTYKAFTLRAGIYNLTNRKYSTWESVRQSTVNAVNQDLGSNYTRFAAPGRNFSVAFEMKF
ncbi:lactoferrin/transferrin family TonB-dependent receptor [Mannheimia granulomatis]